MSFTTVNPATNEQVQTFKSLTRDETLDAVRRAHEAYPDWRAKSFEERKTILLEFARLMRENAYQLAELITLEMGKRFEESQMEIEFCANIVEYYANNAEDFLADEPLDVQGVEAYVQYAPIGVLLGIMPWNFPFYQVVRFMAPNLMAGNTLLVKHASNVPQCAAKIEEMLDQAGLPEGVYTNLFMPTELVETVLADSRVVGVSLTGSERAGAAVAAQAGKHIKRSVLELGGNDAFIVLEDADVDDTVQKAVLGRMINAGQTCVASKRFIVVQAVAEEFISKFKQAVASLTVGDPMDPDTQIGPLSSEKAAQDLDQQVQSAVAAGATVLVGGGRPDREGAFYNPTILTDVTPDSPTYDQELFGPVATVYVVQDEAAAVKLANDSSYGLGGSVYTSDVQRGRRVAEQIDTGMMFVNQPTTSQVDLPFGGTKNSGYGRELSEAGIKEFVNRKLIHLGPKA